MEERASLRPMWRVCERASYRGLRRLRNPASHWIVSAQSSQPPCEERINIGPKKKGKRGASFTGVGLNNRGSRKNVTCAPYAWRRRAGRAQASNPQNIIEIDVNQVWLVHKKCGIISSKKHKKCGIISSKIKIKKRVFRRYL